MSFESEIEAHKRRRDERLRRIGIECAEEVARSVVEGSELTGAPGQPVQLGTLRGSWVSAWVSRTLWRIVTKLVYAPVIETLEGKYGPITIRSPVGGGHSVAKTRTGWQNIVKAVAARHAA